MVRILQLISKYCMKRRLNKIRIKKPSLLEYYAMYRTGKKLEDLRRADIENAERELIPQVLGYYLDSSLTSWDKRIERILHGLKEFYLYFCQRKYLDLDGMDLKRLVRGQYSIEEMLNWCKSAVPRTKYAFWALLKRTRPDDIQRVIELGILSREEILEVYQKRKQKLIPAVRKAIKEVLKPERSLHKKPGELKVSKKKRARGIDVFRAYLEVTNQDSVSYLKRLEIKREFKVILAKIWFTSKNRDERLNRLNEAFPGLTGRVGYTKLWDYVRTEIDEFILVEALSREQIVDYLERNKWKLGRNLKRKFEKALELLERSYR